MRALKGNLLHASKNASEEANVTEYVLCAGRMALTSRIGGGNSLHEADLSYYPLRKIHLHGIKASDTFDEGGAWMLIEQRPRISHVRSPFHLNTSQVNK